MLQHSLPLWPHHPLRAHSTAVALAHTELSVVPLVGEKTPRRHPTETLDPLSWGPASLSLRVFCPNTLQCIRMFAIVFRM